MLPPTTPKFQPIPSINNIAVIESAPGDPHAARAWVFRTLGISFAYLLVGDFVGNLLNSSALVALTGLMAGWIAIAVVQEITAETFRGFHDIRLPTLLGGLATGARAAA